MTTLLAISDRVPLQWPRTNWVDGLYIVTVIVAVWAAYQLFIVARRARKWISQYRPFWRVAGAVGLGWLQRWQLIRVARHGGLATPLSLILCSQTLDHHARQYQQRLSPAGARRWERSRLDIHRKLFVGTTA